MTQPTPDRVCPGCGGVLAAAPSAVYEGYFNTLPECWARFTELIGREFSHAILFGQVHQLSVDSYAVQHAGYPHPDKSVDVHLSGLYLALDLGWPGARVTRGIQQLANRRPRWPHFDPPTEKAGVTVIQVLASEQPADHAVAVRGWAREVWSLWRPHHRAVAHFVTATLGLDVAAPNPRSEEA